VSPCSTPAWRDGDTRLCLQGIKQVAPAAGVIVTDVPPVLQAMIAFIKAGANGFILKDATMDDVVATVRSVARGMDMVPAPLASELVSCIADRAFPRPPPGALPRAASLTKRERQITSLIAEGMTNKEIAQRLNIGLYTVKSHVHNLLEKSALHSRLQVAAYAHKGWTADPDSTDREASRLMEKTG
jgi:two-component system, NarL family, nitrate/nitrite response regulator NarL